MGAGQDVEPGHVSPQHAAHGQPSPMLETKLGVKGARVHKAEDSVVDSLHGLCEVLRVVSVGDCQDRSVRELRERGAALAPPPPACSGRPRRPCPGGRAFSVVRVAGGERSGTPSSRRAPTGHRDLRPKVCRGCARAPHLPRPSRTAASRRRRDRHPLLPLPPSSTLPATHHRAQGDRTPSQRSARPRHRGLVSGCVAGGSRRTSMSGGSSASVDVSSGAHRSAVAPSPVTTMGS